MSYSARARLARLSKEVCISSMAVLLADSEEGPQPPGLPSTAHPCIGHYTCCAAVCLMRPCRDHPAPLTRSCVKTCCPPYAKLTAGIKSLLRLVNQPKPRNSSARGTVLPLPGNPYGPAGPEAQRTRRAHSWPTTRIPSMRCARDHCRDAVMHLQDAAFGNRCPGRFPELTAADGRRLKNTGS